MPHRKNDKKIIVIVDNNVSSELEGLENALATEDDGKKYDVYSFQDPLEVIECLRSERGMRYDLAVVDLTFDEGHRGLRIDGTDVIELMKEHYPNKPVICCSAYAENKHVQSEFRTAKHQPDAAFSKKKYTPGRMLDIVEGCLKKYKRRLTPVS